VIEVTDQGGLQRLLRESDPSHFSAVARTAVIAQAPAAQTDPGQFGSLDLLGTSSTATVT
jgi:hypothetical protein